MGACDLKYLAHPAIDVLDGLALETHKMLTALLRRLGGLT